eukprot:scaffold442_cov268-Pinguiococcus_pyrenoidosus.AAC.116
MEFRLGKRSVEPDGDFVEGVRALLVRSLRPPSQRCVADFMAAATFSFCAQVDKDKKPNWRAPPSAEELALFFAPLDPSDELTFIS